MPSGDEQAHRDGWEGAVLEFVDDDMARQMVDRVDRDSQAKGECLGRRSADEECAGEARAGSDRDGVEVGERNIRIGAGSLEGRNHRLEVGTARNFGDDPAEACVLLDARRDSIGEEGGPADDAHTCLIAGGLDTENEGFVHVSMPVIGRSRMMAASMPRS